VLRIEGDRVEVGPGAEGPAGVESHGRIEVLSVRPGAAGDVAGQGQVRDLLSGWDDWAGLCAESVLRQYAREVYKSRPICCQHWPCRSRKLEPIRVHKRRSG